MNIEATVASNAEFVGKRGVPKLRHHLEKIEYHAGCLNWHNTNPNKKSICSALGRAYHRFWMTYHNDREIMLYKYFQG
jgi:hypothetical protein